MPFFITSQPEHYKITNKTLADQAALDAIALEARGGASAGRGYRSNRQSISRIEQPGVVIDVTDQIDLNHPSIMLVIFQDLSFWLIESGEVSTYDYPAGSTLSGINGLGDVAFRDILAASSRIVAITNGMRDLLETPRDVTSPEYYHSNVRDEPDLSDGEIDAIKRLLKKPGWGNKSRPDETTSDETTSDAIIGKISNILIAGVQDSIFSAEKASFRNWTDTQADEVKATTLQILHSDRRIARQSPSFSMKVRILAQQDGGSPEIDIQSEDAHITPMDFGAIEKRITIILDALYRVSGWSGEDWEYNDDAYHRVSGYDQDPAEIAFIDFTNASTTNHQRLSESRTLIARLVATGMGADAASALVNH